MGHRLSSNCPQCTVHGIASLHWNLAERMSQSWTSSDAGKLLGQTCSK